MKKSFIIYDNWALMFSQMPNEDAGALIKKICNYKLTGEFEEGYSSVNAIFSMIKLKLDEDAEKYEETCEKRRQAIQSRWNNKENDTHNIQTDTNVIQMNTNVIQMNTDTDTDTDTDTYNIKKENIKEKRFTPPTVEEVRDYCRERNNNVDPVTFVDFYTAKGWCVGKNKMKDWKACVRTWERNRDKKQNNNSELIKSNYDFDSLKKEIHN